MSPATQSAPEEAEPAVPFWGLIAAAGDSSRMGRCKALVTLAGIPLVERIATTLLAGGAARVLVTVGPGPAGRAIVRHVADALGSTGRVQCLPNAWMSRGYSGSIETATRHVEPGAGLMVTPVDAPFASAELVRLLVHHGSSSGRAAARPRVDGVAGHPIFFAASTLPRLRELPQQGGPRRMLASWGEAVVEVPWGDRRVTWNLNTPEDLAQASSTCTAAAIVPR